MHVYSEGIENSGCPKQHCPIRLFTLFFLFNSAISCPRGLVSITHLSAAEGATDSSSRAQKDRLAVSYPERERERATETPNLLFGGEIEDDTDEDDVMQSKSAE